MREITERRKRRAEEVYLCYLKGWTYKEVAEETGYSIRTIQRDVQMMKERARNSY